MREFVSKVLLVLTSIDETETKSRNGYVATWVEACNQPQPWLLSLSLSRTYSEVFLVTLHRSMVPFLHLLATLAPSVPGAAEGGSGCFGRAAKVFWWHTASSFGMSSSSLGLGATGDIATNQQRGAAERRSHHTLGVGEIDKSGHLFLSATPATTTPGERLGSC